MTKRITITITDRQFEMLNQIVESGVWGNKPSSVAKDIIISKLNTPEKTIEKALEKAGWNEVYLKGDFGKCDKKKDEYVLVRTFTRSKK